LAGQPVTALAGVVLAFVAGLAGCSHLSREGRSPKRGLLAREQALLARIQSHEKGKKKADLERKLERVRFIRASRVGTIAAFRSYLRRHPKGLFSPKAESKLAELRFQRANEVDTWWIWEWFLAHHPRSKQAEQATARLQKALVDDFADNPDERRMRDFLRRFPEADQREAVLELLAKKRYAEVKDSRDAMKLELFVRMFPGTKWAAKVRARLEKLWRSRVELLGTWRELDAYAERYPKSPHLEDLEKTVGRRMLRRAIASLSLDGLAEVVERMGNSSPLGARGAEVLAAAKKRPDERARLMLLSRAARPYRPPVRLRALLAGASGDNLRTAFISVQSLAYFPRPRALETLTQLVGGSPWSLSLLAWMTLDDWFERTPDRVGMVLSEDLERRLTKRLPHPTAALRFAALRIARRRVDKRVTEMLSVARKASKATKRSLLTLAVELAGAVHGAAPRPQAALSFVESSEARVEQLVGAVPATITRANLGSVRTVVFQLHALIPVVRKAQKDCARSGLMTPSLAQRLTSVLGDAEMRLTKLLKAIGKVDPDAARSLRRAGDFASRASKSHRRGRSEAWRELRAAKGELAKRVRAALCSRPRWAPGKRGCPDEGGEGGKSAASAE
jgi:hypothetical protein